jgi:hypothetical protein
MDTITYVGLDVHKATVCVALAESGRGDSMSIGSEVPEAPKPRKIEIGTTVERRSRRRRSRRQPNGPTDRTPPIGRHFVSARGRS